MALVGIPIVLGIGLDSFYAFVLFYTITQDFSGYFLNIFVPVFMNRIVH